MQASPRRGDDLNFLYCTLGGLGYEGRELVPVVKKINQHQSIEGILARCNLFICHRVMGPLLAASLWRLCILYISRNNCS